MEKVSDERLETLIAFAEQTSKPWIAVDVPNALRELRAYRKYRQSLLDAGRFNAQYELDAFLSGASDE